MGAQSFWHLFVVDDDAITPEIRRAVTEPHDPEAYQRAWDEWAPGWRDVSFDLHRRDDGMLAEAPSTRPYHHLAPMELREPEALVLVAEALYERFGQTAFSIMRRPPFGPYLHAYGPDRCRTLPGVLGNIAADATEIARIAPTVANSFDLSLFERRDVRRRTEAWCRTCETTPDEAAEMLAALPRLVAEAAATGRGLVGITAVT